MKTNLKKFIAILLTVIMSLSLVTVTAFADENDMTVVVSLEGLTIGQGLYIEPTAYTLDEINELVATKGYGPYTEDNLTAAMATLAAFIDNGISVDEITGWNGGLYITEIKGLDNGTVNIPEAIAKVSGISNEDNLGNSDDYLGTYDYSYYSGWMFIVNNEMASVGAADYVFAKNATPYDNTWVVRWCYSIYGWGVDLGGDGWGMFPLIDGEFANPDNLYIAYAEAKYPASKNTAKTVINTYMPSQADVDAVTEAITNYSCNHLCHSDSGFLQFIWKIVNFFNKLFKTNATCSCGLAHY